VASVSEELNFKLYLNVASGYCVGQQRSRQKKTNLKRRADVED
jgi:hypothetical protein